MKLKLTSIYLYFNTYLTYHSLLLQVPEVKVPEAPKSMDMPMPFNYAYGVEDQDSGVQMGSKADSDGIVTTGEYSVLLPDGRMQVVRYRVDPDNGYQAEVFYEPAEPLF